MAVITRRRPVEVGRLGTRRRWQVTRSSAAMASTISGATTSTCARHSTRPATFWRGHPAAADDEARLAGQHEVDRVERAVDRHRRQAADDRLGPAVAGSATGGPPARCCW